MSDDSRLPAVEIQGLRKVYRQIIAVDDISLVAYRGEAFGFLGPNGAGKSTVVKILTGLVTPTKGTVRVLGQQVNHVQIRRQVGYLPEFPSFHRWLKARDFLEFHGRLYGLKSTMLEKRIGEVLARVGLAGRENQKLGTFSKGMLQRIGLAQYTNCAFCGCDQAGEYLHDCTFPCAVWSKKAESLAPIGDKADIIYCDDLPVNFT